MLTEDTRSAAWDPSSTEVVLERPVEVTTSCPLPLTPGTVTLSLCTPHPLSMTRPQANELAGCSMATSDQTSSPCTCAIWCVAWI